MKPLNEFIIQFSGLSDGIYHFKYEINKKFFDEISSDLIQNGNIEIEVIFHKTPQLLTFDFRGKGTVDAECDRCTTSVKLPIEGFEEKFLMIRFDNIYQNDNSEIMVISDTESEVNIAEPVFEFINSLIPFSIISCEILNDKSICNKEILNKFLEYSSKKKNDNKQDPRWDTLEKLKGKLN